MTEKKQEILLPGKSEEGPPSVVDVLNKSIEGTPLDPVVLGVANLYLEGKNVSDIASEFDVPADIISNILDREDVKSYVDNIFFSSGYMHRMKRLDLINKVIEQKFIEGLETGVYSKKDLLDWVKEVNRMEADARPKTRQPTVAIQVNNNYDRLMKELLDKE